MPGDITPDSLRQASFRTTFRGLDPTEVRETLEAAAATLDALDAERRTLQTRLEESLPARDMEQEFDDIGREVAAILQTAREAAETMRERASLDAARWRSEAMEETDTMRKDAAADAESLRRDAWVTGTELLDQAVAKAESMRANAKRDVLTVMGEAEREAHRLTSGARREAEDVVRNATMDAELIANEATTRRDEIIDAANRQAASAQERTRALEQRRDELLEELENVRATLTRLEGSLDERREALDLPSGEASSVKVVHPPEDAKKQWQLGETVRVVPSDKGPARPPDEGLADEVSEQVARSRPAVESQESAKPEEPVDDVPEPAITDAAEPTSTEIAEAEPAEAPGSRSDDLSALFAALRESGNDQPAIEKKAPNGEAEETDEEPEVGVDWIEMRERQLLPITNRALRGVKKAMTEVQNVALDSLRTDDDWRPDTASISESLHAEVVAVWSESFAAGHTVAEQMIGSRLRRPPTPPSRADHVFASDLSSALGLALDGAGEGTRERQSAASRVFRVWRSDEAERRIRNIALEAYEAGIEESRKVATG